MQDVIEIKPLLQTLTDIRNAMLEAERQHRDLINQVQPHYRDSARNLVHYLALRTFDLRDVQWRLSSLGLSSLGHSERYSLVNMQNILFLLQLLNGGPSVLPGGNVLGIDRNYPRSQRQLEIHTVGLFGPEAYPGHTRIMVTLPSEAAHDYQLVEDLVKNGMNIARINCSHDNEAVWMQMIAHLHRAQGATKQQVLLYMDLAGPKLRTGELPPRLSRKGKPKRPYLLLRQGDTLRLVRELRPATLPTFAPDGNLLSPGEMSVTLPDIFDEVLPGQRIWFDDGKIGGLIQETHPDHLTVKITFAQLQGSKLYAGKGINLPDTQLKLPALTADDLQNLPFILRHADMVGYSFVRRASDVQLLQDELRRLGREDIGLILKIETRETFENLPSLILAAMRSPRIGVMIARGDLAVELGFLRISEVQEQIMWLCEAAHVPAIWATQILETLAKTGRATRAEISDAVLSVRAECAMLNKGPYILEAVRTLHDIDQRMAPHQSKKQNNLRPLSVAGLFMGAAGQIDEFTDEPTV